MRTKQNARRANGKGEVIWGLRLYVAGQTPKSITAYANLKKICEEHLAGRYWIEIIDLLRKPPLGCVDQIVAIPTLVRRIPEPPKKIIGDLSNTTRVLTGLGLHQNIETHQGQQLPGKNMP